MGNAENAPARSGLGWFPKLFLWTSVIAFGYLYLSSIDRRSSEETGSPSVIASQIDKALSAMHLGRGEPTVSDVKTDEPAVGAAPVANPAPVNATEAAVFANSLMAKPEVAEEKPVLESGQAALAGSGVDEAGLKEEKPMSESGQASVSQEVSPPQEPKPLTADAMTPLTATEAVQGATSTEPVQREQARVPQAGSQSFRQETMAQYQARMMAEYEAMRRSADNQMRQYWSRMQVPSPAPYMYPGHAAVYGPGYPPGAYAPR